MTIHSITASITPNSSKVLMSQVVAANRPLNETQPQSEDSATLTANFLKQANAISIDVSTLNAKRNASIEYDNNTHNQQAAISSYLTIQHSAKREEIQQMVGIDLYA